MPVKIVDSARLRVVPWGHGYCWNVSGDFYGNLRPFLLVTGACSLWGIALLKIAGRKVRVAPCVSRRRELWGIAKRMNYVEFHKYSMKFHSFASCASQICAEGVGVWRYGVGGFSSDLFVFSRLVTKVVGGGVARSWLLPPAVASPAWERLENKKMRNFSVVSQQEGEGLLFFCFATNSRDVTKSQGRWKRRFWVGAGGSFPPVVSRPDARIFKFSEVLQLYARLCMFMQSFAWFCLLSNLMLP